MAPKAIIRMRGGRWRRTPMDIRTSIRMFTPSTQNPTPFPRLETAAPRGVSSLEFD
jgi:hypothetical protein